VQILFLGKIAEISGEYLPRELGVYVEGRFNTGEREGEERDRHRVKRITEK
jgi:single-stranded DNA-binding protein